MLHIIRKVLLLIEENKTLKTKKQFKIQTIKETLHYKVKPKNKKIMK